MITFHFNIISKTTPEMPTLIVLRRKEEFDKLNSVPSARINQTGARALYDTFSKETFL
jgi:hypothetical protein